MGHYAAEMRSSPDPLDDERREAERNARMHKWIITSDLDVITLAEHLATLPPTMRTFEMYMTEVFETRQEAEEQALTICRSRYAHHAETAAKLKAFLDNPETAPWK